jgi:hypothetical protein
MRVRSWRSRACTIARLPVLEPLQGFDQ